MALIRDPVKEAAIEAIRSTCSLYLFCSRASNLPRPLGCCVLLEYNQQYFVLSNAHVLSDGQYGKAQFLVGDGLSSTIGGVFLSSRLPASGNREDDLLDIAIVRLNSSTTELLKQAGYTFLGMNQVVTGHTQQPADSLLMAGYPASRTTNKIKGRKVEVRSLPFYFKAHGVTRTGRGRYSSDHHVFANYPRTKLLLTNHTGRVTGPMPDGLSGSGMWLLGPDDGGRYRPSLVAVFMEYDENRSLLVGTRIDYFIDIIRQRLDPSIPNYSKLILL